MIILFFFLNAAISWFNAWSCGRVWNSTKAQGGLAHFMNWMGAIMAASGFTWCYLVLFGFVGTLIPVTRDGQETVLLDPPMLEAFAKLGYLMVIGPVIGSGLAITIHSWRAFARSRTFGNGAIAGWNTYAQISNMYSAAQHIPDAFDGIGKFFGGKDSKDGKGMIVVLLVALALLAGVLTTIAILKSAAESAMLAEYYKAEREVA